MKELITNSEMQKFQDTARKMFVERNVLDLDAAIIGWKLDAGRILHSAEKNVTVELLEKPQPQITGIVKVSMNGKESETSINTIAKLIVTNQVTVYYSK